MAYTGAKAGQIVYWATKPWQDRDAVELVRYYKDNKNLTHPNMAVISHNGVHIHVSIKNIYRKELS